MSAKKVTDGQGAKHEERRKVQHCQDCKHFDQDGTPQPGWGHCMRAKSNYGQPAQGMGRLAFAVDAAKFGARLNVAPDFGCIEWEQKL